MTLYVYHKKFSLGSIGGVSTCISRSTAKMLISKMKGRYFNEKYWYNKGERKILFNNGNYIFMYVV